jgi:hypothetical protein
MDPTLAYLGVFLFFVYVVLLFTAGLTTFRKGHTILGIVGVVLPVLWLVGAMLPPKKQAVKAASRSANHKRSANHRRNRK